MAHNKAMKSSETRSRVRRGLMLGILSSSLFCAFIPSALADKLSCLPPQRLSENPTPAPANKKIGVTVAYLKVPFYANFKTGLEDGPVTLSARPSLSVRAPRYSLPYYAPARVLLYRRYLAAEPYPIMPLPSPFRHSSEQNLCCITFRSNSLKQRPQTTIPLSRLCLRAHPVQ